MKRFFAIFISLNLVGCWSTENNTVSEPSKSDSKPAEPETLAEKKANYTYIPLNPIPSSWEESESCRDAGERLPLVEALPDQTVRMSVKKISSNGEFSFTGFKSAGVDDRFEVTLDYIMSDTVSLDLLVAKYLTGNAISSSDERDRIVNIKDSLSPEQHFIYTFKPFDKDNYKLDLINGWDKITIPVYVGVGVRMTAEITILNASAELGGIFSLAATANRNKISGTLALQTIGATSEKITATLPVPNEINEATLTNALISMGAIKSMLHEPETKTSPRVVGFYNPFGGGAAFVNTIIQALSDERITWRWRCEIPINPKSEDSSDLPSG